MDRTDDRFEVADRTDEVSHHTYGKATLTKFELDLRQGEADAI
ncbi:hypothetical protein [Streptococcus pneumoniae]|nr:hypothetical protein [Streptococcus pneumoniae]